MWFLFKPRFNAIEIFLTIVVVTLMDHISWWANMLWSVPAFMFFGLIQAWVESRKEN